MWMKPMETKITGFRLAHRLARGLAGCALLCSLLLIPACNNVEEAGPSPDRAKFEPKTLELDVPQIMRGTIAGETIVLGYQDIVVRGYGLVVGLKGTGSRTLNSQIRGYMLNEMRKMGVGSAQDPNKISPEMMLSSPDTAVVIVEAVLPAGAVKGTQFDVRVLAEPSTGTTSLEGGRLYTTPLRPGPLMATGRQPAPLAFARGPIFINPFSEPSANSRDSILRTVGRILNGGIANKDLPIKLRLATPSHARAETIQNSINSNFPREPGQRDPTARGENDTVVRITVPPSWRNDSREFIEVLRHSTIRIDAVEQTATFVQRTMLANPGSAGEAAWRWQAIGKRSLSIIQPLYDYPEEGPRLAALQAGAKLNDALTVKPLLEMASSSTTQKRLDTIGLLAEMGVNPTIEIGLRKLLDDEDVDVRLAAVDALIKRGDPFLQRVIVDNKFELYLVPSEKPLIYVSQTGVPRITVFKKDLAISTPLNVFMWSNRLMIKEDSRSGKLEVYFRKIDDDRGDAKLVDPSLDKFIPFLGHTVTIEAPQPGLGLEYGEVVGALHEIWAQRFIPGDFKAEQDRILAAILRAKQETEIPERPEFGDPDFDYLEPDGGASKAPDEPLAPPAENPFESSSDRLEWAPAVNDTGR